MKPSEKSPELNSFLNEFSQNVFGRNRTEAIENDVCVECGESAKEFKDALSQKEYSISGLCQKCQDKIWG